MSAPKDLLKLPFALLCPFPTHSWLALLVSSPFLPGLGEYSVTLFKAVQ